MTRDKRAYTGGHFALQIDGHSTTAFVKSVDGGFKRVHGVSEKLGATNMQVKHVATTEVEPMTIECGLAHSYEILRWVEQAWKMKPKPFNGQVTHADFDLHPVFEHEFFDAYVTEAIFPALDGESKDPGYLKFKLQPSDAKIRTVSSKRRLEIAGMSSKQKQWNASRFHFTIDGLDDMRFTNKLESFTIKMGVQRPRWGEVRDHDVVPTKIDFPTLSGTIALGYADQLIKWGKDAIENGMSDAKAQKTGAIEYLSHDGKTLFMIHLYDVGIIQLKLPSSTANQPGIKRVQFELFVGRMELDPGKPFGMA